MGSILFLLCALALFARGDLALALASRRGRSAVMDEVSRGQRALARKLFFLAGLLGGLRTEFTRFPGPLPRVFLVVSNHQSLADIPALAQSFPHHGVRFVAKRELGRGILYVSRNLRKGESALLSRTSDFRAGQRELRRLGALSEEGICPAVFPEGTRSRSGRVQDFYNGAVRVILEGHPMPVLSVAVDGGHSIATITRLLTRLRGTTYRVKPLTLYPAPNGKREIIELLGKLKAEITGQVRRWRNGR
jgi:1-acyl-sn-glycerol-3-phosphate acyltransferase